MAGDRPSRRGSRVVYREAPDSDEELEIDDDTKIILIDKQDIGDDSNDTDYTPGGQAGVDDFPAKRVVTWPPLNELQREFRQVCRLGDRVKLKQFLTDRPGIDLDVKCHDGTTALNEAVTKTAQFTGIVEVLLDFGARLDVSDSLGNSPLHNAVLYHPSTQDTVDLLLLRGADTGAKNYEEQTPVTMADDKDLKEVLKELKKGVKKKIKAPERSREVAYSPDLRRKVTNSGGLDRLRPDLLVVRFNNRPLPASPGLLKRRRATEDTEEGGEGSRPRKRRRTDGGEDEQSCERRKRIKWVEKDSTGAPIDPQFSEEEGEASEAANSVERGGSVDSSEDVAAYPHGYGHSVSEIADIPGRVAIENHDLLENDNATLADDLVSTERLEWHRSEEGAQAQPQFTLLRSPPKADGHLKAIQAGDDEKVYATKDVLEFSSESQEDVAVSEASRDEDDKSEEDDRNKLMRTIRVNQILRGNQTEQTAVREPVTPEMLKRASEYVHNNKKEDEILSKRSRRDSNENMMLGSTKSEPLRIHMKANGDDSELDSDLSQDGSAPKVIKFTGGFGFFVN